MATFATFNDRLPDPTFGVNNSAVVDATGTKGPGFLSVSVKDNEETQVSRTISGRGVHRSRAEHFWEISIRYNPMLRDQFDIVDGFLQSRKARRKPFYVVLPQYSKPRDTAFAAFVTTNAQRVVQATAAGSDRILMDAGGSLAITGSAKIGDFFTITDSGDVNHQKAYKVIGVETPAYYQAGTTAPPANSYRLIVNPPIQRFTNANAVVNWINPKFRVMMKGDVIEHELDTEGTYQFGLELEEILP